MEKPNNNLPELPEGMHLEDLRFVHAEQYAISMAAKSWLVSIEQGIEDNPAKVCYSLSRTLKYDFDTDTYWKFLLEQGIAESADDFAPGYNSHIEGISGPGVPDDSPSNTYRLTFVFEGFPTEDTMDNLAALDKFFSPEPTRLKRWLGKLGVRS